MSTLKFRKQCPVSTGILSFLLATAGTEVVGGTPQELSADIKAEVEKWAKLVRERGLTFD